MNSLKTTFLFIALAIGFFKSIAQTNPQCTWVTGSKSFNQVATYGTMGTAAAANIPGGRENSVSWTDNNNNLWLFGGHGYTTTGTQGYMNDLWKYDQSANKWTWVLGNNTLNQHGVYGTKGLAASGNFPGARQNAVTWKDNAGNLWLFGGEGYAAGGAFAFLNDLWKYDIALNQWTWISGANTGGQVSTYGSLGVSSALNIPSARFGACGWIDTNNNLWLFGGQGFGTAQ